MEAITYEESNNLKFQIVYDGPALEGSEMSAKDLAESLVAITDVLENLNEVLNGSKSSKVAIKVSSSLKSGCFKIDFHLIQSVLENLKNFLGSGSVSAVLNAAGIYSILENTIKLIKFLGGQPPEQIIDLKDGNVKIIKSDKFLEVEKDVLRVYREYKIREALDRAINKPLSRDGFDSFALTKDQKHYEEVDKSTKDLFDFTENETQETTIITDAEITIVSLSFKEGNKWRVSYSGNEYYASLEDSDFVNKINQGEIEFAKGDALTVDMEKIVTKSQRKYKEELIIKILKGITKSPKQTTLKQE
jgi:hypothetical protein